MTRRFMQACPICDGDGRNVIHRESGDVFEECGRCKSTGYITIEHQSSDQLVFSKGRLVKNEQLVLSGHYHGVQGAWYPCADTNCQWNRSLHLDKRAWD